MAVETHKNALTKYFVATVPEGSAEPTWIQLQNRISAVNDGTDETTEDTAWYSGDGTLTTDVVGVKKVYSFEGQRLVGDPAQDLVAALEFEVGDARKIMFKQERTDKKIYSGIATVSAIVVTGGEASDFAPFTCDISWDNKPTIADAPVVPAG